MSRTLRLALLALALTSAACSGGDDDDNRPAPGPQNPPKATLYLHGAAPGELNAVGLYLNAVEVHIDNAAASYSPTDPAIETDASWKSIPLDGLTDLVPHGTQATALPLGSAILAGGNITQIRLRLDTTKQNYANRGGSLCLLETSQVNAGGVRVTKAFAPIAAGMNQNFEIWLDLDLTKGFQPVGDCYELVPSLEISKATRNGAAVAL